MKIIFTRDRFTTQRNVTEVRRRVHVICRRLCGKLKRNIPFFFEEKIG
jgi:hypothetical protein